MGLGVGRRRQMKKEEEKKEDVSVINEDTN